MATDDAPTLAQILEVFEASGLDLADDELRRQYTAKSDSARLVVWWDASDPENIGWAWELRRYDPEGNLVSDDSGGLDSIEELTGLVESLTGEEVEASELDGETS